MIVFTFDRLAQIFATHALNAVLEGLALAALTWGVLRLFGARNSMMRFAVWFATLLVVAGLPLLLSSGSVTSSNSPSYGIALSSGWAWGFFIAWGVGAGIFLTRLGISLAHIHGMRRECRELGSAAFSALAQDLPGIAQSDRVGFRKVKFLVSESVRVPAAIGFFRPAVVLPAWSLRELSAAELRLILLHELAHLRRWDDWTNLAQKMVKALFFFHPAVWWIDSRLALEREMACDDLVLAQSANARSYAASLVSVAEKTVAQKLRMERVLALAQSLVGRVRELSLRVSQIMDTKRSRATGGWKSATALIGTLTVIAIGSVPYAPELISFRNSEPPSSSTFSNEKPFVAVIPAKWVEQSAAPVRKGEHFASIPALTRQFAAVRRTEPRTETRSMAIPAKAHLHSSKRVPGVVMTSARPAVPPETLLVIRSTQVDGSATATWTLSVWRISTSDGQQQAIQIVMNSI